MSYDQMNKIRNLLISVLFLLILCFTKQDVFAAEVEVTFGSDFYEEQMGEEFPLGVYITGTEALGYYRVELSYDATKMRYVDGGTSAANGVIVISGSSRENAMKHMLHFEAIGAGRVPFYVKDVVAKASDEEAAEPYSVKTMAHAPITIVDPNGENEEETSNAEADAVEEGETDVETTGIGEGVDANVVDSNSGETGNQPQAADTNDVTSGMDTETTNGTTSGMDTEATNGTTSDTNTEDTDDATDTLSQAVMGQIMVSGVGNCSLLDHRIFVPEQVDWQYYLEQGTCQGKEVTFLSDSIGSVRILYLMDKAGHFLPYGVSEDGNTLMPCEVVLHMDTEYLQVPLEVATLPEGLAMEQAQAEGIVCYLNKSGNCYFYRQDETGRLLPWNYAFASVNHRQEISPLIYCVAGVAVLVFLIAVIGSAAVVRREREDREEEEQVEDLFEFDGI